MPYKNKEYQKQYVKEWKVNRRIKFLKGNSFLKKSLAPTVKPTLLDIVWAAGIYEGEGSCNHYRLYVGQKDRWILDKLRNLFGGSVSCQLCKSGIYNWTLSGARGRGLAMTIYSFLSPRRKEQVRKMW